MTICQTRFGDQIKRAIAAAIQGYFVRSSIRSEGVRRTAAPMPRDETDDRVLHLEPDPERDSQVDPVPWPAVDDKAEKPVQGDHPGHLIEGHGLEDPVRAEQEWRRDGSEQRNSLEPERAA